MSVKELGRNKMATTPFSKKCEILGELWDLYRDSPRNKTWEDFFYASDVSLPVSYLLSKELVSLNSKKSNETKVCINDSWEMIFEITGLDSKQKYDDLSDVLGISEFDSYDFSI